MITTLEGLPVLGVRYRDHGAQDYSFIRVSDTGEQASTITDLLANRGLRAEAITINVQPNPQVFAVAARNLAIELADQVLEGEIEASAALNTLAPLHPGLSDTERADLLDELVHELNKANRIEAGDYDRNVCEPYEDQQHLEAACEAAVIEAADKLIGGVAG